MAKIKLNKYIVTSSIYDGMITGTCFESEKDLDKVVNVARYNTAIHADIAINPPPAPGRPAKDEPEEEEEVEEVFENFKQPEMEVSKATKTSSKTANKK